MSIHSYPTRSNPSTEILLENNKKRAEQAIQAGNKQLASLHEELNPNNVSSSWACKAAKIVPIAAIALLALSMLYECYDLQTSTDRLYSQNIEFGKQHWSAKASIIISQITQANPTLKCLMDSKVVDLVSCYAMGLAKYFTPG